MDTLSQNMKKIITGLACALLLIANVAFASITFDPVSPQVVGSSIGIGCSLGDHYVIFLPDGSWFTGGTTGGTTGGEGCTSSTSGSSDGSEFSVPGSYYYGECDSTLTEDCVSPDIDAFRLNTGYISDTTFEFTPVLSDSDIFTSQETGGTTTYTLSDSGWVLLNEFFRFSTFALAFITLLLSFGFYFAITSKK